MTRLENRPYKSAASDRIYDYTVSRPIPVLTGRSAERFNHEAMVNSRKLNPNSIDETFKRLRESGYGRMLQNIK